MATYSWNSFTIQEPSTCDVDYVTMDSVLQSRFTGAIQTVHRSSGHWVMRCTWTNILGEERAKLLAFLLRVNGTEHRVRMPFFGQKQRGDLGGSPVVDGAGQTGTSLNIRGCDPSVTNWMRVGDVFRYDNALRVATTDADSDGTGDATITFVPPIRTSPADGVALQTAASITGIMALTSAVPMGNVASMRQSNGDLYSTIQADFIDDVTA